jgi:hypothetical protein
MKRLSQQFNLNTLLITLCGTLAAFALKKGDQIYAATIELRSGQTALAQRVDVVERKTESLSLAFARYQGAALKPNQTP